MLCTYFHGIFQNRARDETMDGFDTVLLQEKNKYTNGGTGKSNSTMARERSPLTTEGQYKSHLLEG